MVNSQVCPQQIPYCFQGVDVHLAPGVLLPPMLYRLVAVTQASQEAIDVILIGVHLRLSRHQPLNEGLDRLPSHVGQGDEVHRSLPVHQAQHGHLVRLGCPSSRLFQPPSSGSTLQRQSSRAPLVTGDDVGLVNLYRSAQQETEAQREVGQLEQPHHPFRRLGVHAQAGRPTSAGVGTGRRRSPPAAA